MIKEAIRKHPVQVEWNYDTANIPRGYWEKRTKVQNDKKIEYDFFVTQPLWVVVNGNFDGANRTIVNRTYWIPSENRWCMMCEGQDGIIAWAHSVDLTKYDLPPVLPLEIAS